MTDVSQHASHFIAKCPPNDPNRRAIAKHYELAEFEDLCHTHGFVKYDTKTNRCLSCSPRRVVNRARAEARKAGEATYVGECPTHGETAFHVQSGTCATCTTAVGSPRTGPARPRNGARAEARMIGATYLDRCATHGETPHHVNTGRCLTCFTATGAPRAAPTPPSARAEARRAGLRTYPARCDKHGETDHHVTCGKCATCYNAVGLRRRDPKRAADGPIVAFYLDGVLLIERESHPPMAGWYVEFADLGLTVRVDRVTQTDTGLRAQCSLDAPVNPCDDEA